MILFSLPAIVVMAGLFLYPLMRVFWQSVTTLEGTPTLSGYQGMIKSTLFYKVLLTTLSTSFLATVATLLVAYPIAYHLSRQTAQRRALLMILVLLPFWTSILVKAFAFTVAFGTHGLVNQVIMAVTGLEGPKLLFNRTGVILGLTHNFIPFMVFPILTSLLAQDPALERAARLMGAGPFRIFLRIVLPLSLPGVMAGCVLTFTMSLGFFVTPALLGGRQDVMLANLVDFYTRESLNWTLASSISVVLLVLSVGLILVVSRLPGGRSLLGETPAP
jgi:ABC-type spermidine/putrescine transport system permease subunit I